MQVDHKAGEQPQFVNFKPDAGDFAILLFDTYGNAGIQHAVLPYEYKPDVGEREPKKAKAGKKQHAKRLRENAGSLPDGMRLSVQVECAGHWDAAIGHLVAKNIPFIPVGEKLHKKQKLSHESPASVMEAIM